MRGEFSRLRPGVEPKIVLMLGRAALGSDGSGSDSTIRGERMNKMAVSLVTSAWGAKRNSHGSPSAANCALNALTRATSSTGRTASVATKLNTNSLGLGIESTNLKVSSKAGSVRYWLTPSIDKKAGALESTPARGNAVASVLFRSSLGQIGHYPAR